MKDRDRTVSDAVLDTLARAGIDVVFGYPGGAIMPLYDAFYRHSVRHVLVRHEPAAVFAAIGYAHMSGRVGICCATSGPGATNLLTGLSEAALREIPLVAITGQVRTVLMGTDGFQEADICSISQPITKRSILATDPSRVTSVIRDAIALAMRSPRGPVLVDIPTDVMRLPASAVADPIDQPAFLRQESLETARPAQTSESLCDSDSANGLWDEVLRNWPPGTTICCDSDDATDSLAARGLLNGALTPATRGERPLGLALPAAIGAWWARRTDPALAICDPRGLELSFPEFATLQRYGAPIKIVVVGGENQADGAPDFCALAKAYDIKNFFVPSSGLETSLLAEFRAISGAALLYIGAYVPAGSATGNTIPSPAATR